MRSLDGLARCSSQYGLYPSSIQNEDMKTGVYKRGVTQFTTWNRQCMNRVFMRVVFATPRCKLQVFLTGVQSG